MTFSYATTIGLSTRDGINDVRRTSRLMGGNVTLLFLLVSLLVSLPLHFLVSPNYYLHMLHMSFTHVTYVFHLFHVFVSLPSQLLVLFYFYCIFVIMLNHDDSMPFLFYRDSFASINTQ